jgi:hypothetical protein
MPAHTIRLRAGWLWWPADSEPHSPDRVDLPAAWIRESHESLRLARYFQRPPIDDRHERLELMVAETPGLTEIWLNERLLAARNPAESRLLFVPVPGPLLPRNRLELKVEAPAAHGGAGARASWGEIALVIRETGPTMAGA